MIGAGAYTEMLESWLEALTDPTTHGKLAISARVLEVIGRARLDLILVDPPTRIEVEARLANPAIFSEPQLARARAACLAESLGLAEACATRFGSIPGWLAALPFQRYVELEGLVRRTLAARDTVLAVTLACEAIGRAGPESAAVEAIDGKIRDLMPRLVELNALRRDTAAGGDARRWWWSAHVDVDILQLIARVFEGEVPATVAEDAAEPDRAFVLSELEAWRDRCDVLMPLFDPGDLAADALRVLAAAVHGRRLTPRAHQAIEVWLAADPERVAVVRADLEELAAMRAVVAEEPLPTAVPRVVVAPRIESSAPMRLAAHGRRTGPFELPREFEAQTLGETSGARLFALTRDTRPRLVLELDVVPARLEVRLDHAEGQPTAIGPWTLDPTIGAWEMPLDGLAPGRHLVTVDHPRAAFVFDVAWTE